MIRASFIILSFALLLSVGACTKNGGGGGADEDNMTYAVVNGKEIKGKDVGDRIKNDLADLKRNEYEIKRRAVEEVVQQKILEDEAKRQGTTVDKLFSQFDNLRDKDVSKEDIQNFLKARNVDEKKLTKQEKDSVPQIVRMQRVYEARQRYVSELRAKANVQIKLQRPEERKIDVSVGTGTPRGATNAKVTIVEFSDFQCPYCAQGRRRLDELEAKYKDKIKIFYRNFPLENIHPNAFKAAEAGACALDQNKFWDYHNMLFDNQQKLDEKSLISYAAKAKLDEKAFQECLKSGKKAADIRKDMEEASRYGVNSTPTFFVNGKAVRGAQPVEAFSEIIDEELQKTN